MIVGLISIPVFFFFYKPPTCFDGIQNGNEQGVDCGGSCQRLCASSFLSPDIAWSRFEQVAPGLYNVATYIINPNIDGEALNVPYHIALYDDQGAVITDTIGTVTLPPHRNTLAFQGAVSVGKRVPAKALFEFTGSPDWHKHADSLSAIQVVDKKYNEDSTGSYLSVTLGNGSVYDLNTITAYAVLYDKDGNALGFSRTLIDTIPAGGTNIAPFTWPSDHKGKVISIEVLPVAQ